MNAQYCVEMAVVINDRVYRIYIPHGSPYVDCKSAILEFTKNLEELEKNSIESSQAQQPPVEAEMAEAN